MSETSTLEQLRLAIHGVTAPFSVHGTVILEEPVRLVFQDNTQLEIKREADPHLQEEGLAPLLDRCSPAPFGDGKKTRHDRMVRDALQLNAEGGAFRIEGFDPVAAGLLRRIQKELLPKDSGQIQADLYTVNVYRSGGHFAQHKDTPRGSDTFGTLVVCLPSQFRGGEFILNHRGMVEKLDWGRAIESQKTSEQLHWAAFFGDVDHQIEKVRTGVRVTLTYLLRTRPGTTSKPTIAQELSPSLSHAWQALLADENFLPEGGTLGYPCCHLYHQDARFQVKPTPFLDSSTPLKGRDHLVASTALQAGLKVSFNPYMFENCANETWQLHRFPTSKEKSNLGWQMDSEDLKERLPIRASSESGDDFGITWLEPAPSSDKTTWRTPEKQDSDLPAAAHLHSCDYCPWGYFGNESSEVDLYVFAALHIQIPKFGRGLRPANRSKRANMGPKSKRKATEE